LHIKIKLRGLLHTETPITPQSVQLGCQNISVTLRKRGKCQHAHSTDQVEESEVRGVVRKTLKDALATVSQDVLQHIESNGFEIPKWIAESYFSQL
jgi:hypothetical protein